MPLDHPHWLRGVLDKDALATLAQAGEQAARKPGARLGLTADLAAVLAEESPLHCALTGLLAGARPVRIVWFDKTAGQNWGLPWHQDRVIAVRERAEVPGFGNWTCKAGVWHCEPPVEVLAPMLFVRLHLDPCDAETGTMQIVPGSHEHGLIPMSQSGKMAGAGPVETCVAAAGDVQVLPMLTLHRSLPATRPQSRRVLRVDYAASDLPEPLRWLW